MIVLTLKLHSLHIHARYESVRIKHSGKFYKKIITIDGPSASGKGVLSSSLANHLNFSLLDSGLLYRAYAYSYQSSLITKSIKNFTIYEFR